MADRRRVGGPPGGTSLPVAIAPLSKGGLARARAPGELRKIFLKTGLTPSASGSAYLEIESSATGGHKPITTSKSSCLKLICTVHGPRPLPRSQPFIPQLLLSSRVKFAPFATPERRGYVPDSRERDLAAHLETAIRGSLIGERWPKSGLDIIVTVLEGEQDGMSMSQSPLAEACNMMSILSGCITVASAAIADAGIDCVDLVTGGAAAVVRQSSGPEQIVLDPGPADYESLQRVCVVAYLHSRDEITEIWASAAPQERDSGEAVSPVAVDSVIDMAVEAASAARLVLLEIVEESARAKIDEATIETTKE